MFSRFYKIVIGFVVLIGLLTIFLIVKWPDKYVHIVFCDVGQGDSTLIYHGFSQILIDSGVDERVLSCLNEHMPFWDRSIELVVATHYDNDHIGGFESVFDFYKIGSILTLPFESDSNDFQTLKDIIQDGAEEGLIIKMPFLGQKISFSSGVSLTTLSSYASDVENQHYLQETSLDKESGGVLEQSFETLEKSSLTEIWLSDAFFYKQKNDVGENDLSIALLLRYGNTKVFLTGDLEEAGEEAMIEQGLTTDIDILKVGHHGSKTSSSLGFLQQLQPEVAIISCGKNNKFGSSEL